MNILKEVTVSVTILCIQVWYSSLAGLEWMLTRKVATDDWDAALPQHFLPIKNRLLILQDLVSEVISGLFPEILEHSETHDCTVEKGHFCMFNQYYEAVFV